jgi:hypothetical protein
MKKILVIISIFVIALFCQKMGYQMGLPEDGRTDARHEVSLFN